MPLKSRRNFLLASVVTGSGLYATQRGLRYPRLSFEHRPADVTRNLGGLRVDVSDAIFTPEDKPVNAKTTLRATAPEPALTLVGRPGRYELSISNIASSARIDLRSMREGEIEEQVEGTKRRLIIKLVSDQPVSVRWLVPADDGFKFAVIGDTGGGSELVWNLTRAEQLGALFLLHLGDFNYSDGEYDSAIELFNSSRIPCYVSIGNHDFHDDGLIYERFLNEVGPMNSAFALAGTRFINLDTAADFFPASSGLRGSLLSKLIRDSTAYSDQVFFTHRPVKDPRPHDDHNIGGIGEALWLAQKIDECGGANLLTGHVHHSAELDVEGLHQWTIGEGLGHEDILLKQQVAKLLIGTVEPARPVAYSWQDLNMPWRYHTSPTHLKKLKINNRYKHIDWYHSKIS